MTIDTKLPISLFTEWLAFGERGLSSEAIVSTLTGRSLNAPYRDRDHPRDPSDFRRCQLLLTQVPLARLMFPTVMRDVSPQWTRLVEHWDEIDAAIEAEAPDYLATRNRGSAPKAYRLMRRVIAGGVTCPTCAGSGQGPACEKCKGSGRRGGGRCRATGCWRGHALCLTCRGDGYTTVPAAGPGGP